MNIYNYLLLLVLGTIIGGCDSDSQTTMDETQKLSSTPVKKDSIVFSFAFVGCNRVNRQQENDTTATNASTANLSALKRIFSEISSLERKPETFFFLGDLVLAETDTQKLDKQLQAWVKQYNDKAFSQISASGIELVAIPGNHEMLYYHNYNVPNHDEWPLKGATDIWMKYMSNYMPKDREHVTGTDSLANRMTFSFIRKDVGFILMNTDTYNAPTTQNPYGLEGMIPTQWIINKVKEYQQNPAVKHIFVLGHKPYYVNGVPETGHQGFPEGPVLWPELQKNHVIAMLSAHLHDYQRVQPGNEGTYQIIAGNGGSEGSATFFGYSVINILSNGDVQLISKGFDIGNPYYMAVPNNPSTVRDSTILTWTKNVNPYGMSE